MQERLIPLLLTTDQANALIDVWEAVEHDAELSERRAEEAYAIVDWLRVSLTARGKPPRYTFQERVLQSVRMARLMWKQRSLRWRNQHAVITLSLTREERTALLKLLVLQKSTEEIRPVIEKLRLSKEA